MRSSRDGQGTTSWIRTFTVSRRRRFALTSAVCITILAILTFFIARRFNETPQADNIEPSKKTRQIKTTLQTQKRESIPANTPENVSSPEETTNEVVTNFVNNVWHDEKGRPHYKVARVIRPGQNTIINGKPWRPEKPVFHHPSEVELDVVLSRRPGERIFGDVNWRAFKQDLEKALVDKIEILPDDTPEIIERKQVVMEAKKELIEAIKAGEDPVEILKATREDVNRLADIRDNLQVVIAEMKQEGASEEEIEEAVEAANHLLKQNNIDKPLVSPKTMRERGEAAKLRKLQKKKGR